MRLTFVHPSIGRRRGDRSYISTWQMEPLPVAALAALTPQDVAMRFYDDRMEGIAFDEPTDLVAISTETYTMRRAMQIASEYRRRGVPVVMGGFHPTLCPDEAARYAEAVVIGEAEEAWPRLVDDFRHGCLEKFYRGQPGAFAARPTRYDRRLFRGKRYLPIGLIETARGCRFRCSFCAIQSFFERRASRRFLPSVLAELDEQSRSRRFFFFVDDNFAADLDEAKQFLRELASLKLRWVTQLAINAAHDEEFLSLLASAGCRGALIGFESLDGEALRGMGKAFNTMKGGYAPALANLSRHGIRIYGTFTFGHDDERADAFEQALDFALSNGFYLAAFNHLTPFPGTPLYSRLKHAGRLRYEAWWRDPAYRYNEVPFHPRPLSHEQVRKGCVTARRRFYSLRSIARRGLREVRGDDAFMAWSFWGINAMHRREVGLRDGFPLGDESWDGTILEAR